MAHLLLLGEQVKKVFLVGLDFDRHALHNLETVGRDARNLARVICEEAHLADPEVGKNLRSRAVLAQIGLEPEVQVRLDGVHALFLQFIGTQLVAEPDTSTFLAAQVQEHAPVLADKLHGRLQLLAAIAAHAPENIARKAFAVHAHVNRLAEIGIARHPGHMFHAIGGALVGIRLEITVLGRHMRGCHTLHEFFVTQAVVNQIADGNNLEVELLGHFLELRHAGHSPILVHDFNEGGGRAESSELCEVDSGLGMASTTEHAFFLCIQGRNMPRTAKVTRLGIRVRKRKNGRSTVMGRNAGRAPLDLIDHDGKGGTQNRGVFRRLAREVEFVAALDGERAAKHAPTLVEHEIHLLRCNLLGGDNEIAFVLAVLIIDHDQKIAVLKIFYGLFNRIKQGHVPSDNSQCTCRACRLPRSRWSRQPSCAGSCGQASRG